MVGWLYGGGLLAVMLERLAELRIARRHTAIARSRGAVEYGAEHYPWMVALHVGLLGGCVVEPLWRASPLRIEWTVAMLLVVAAAQALRWWCIATLGVCWNTRVFVVPGAARIVEGPYRFLAHPNYIAVVVEGLALPLAAGAFFTAATFTALNAWLLHCRVRVEDQALEHASTP